MVRELGGDVYGLGHGRAYEVGAAVRPLSAEGVDVVVDVVVDLDGDGNVDLHLDGPGQDQPRRANRAHGWRARPGTWLPAGEGLGGVQVQVHVAVAVKVHDQGQVDEDAPGDAAESRRGGHRREGPRSHSPSKHPPARAPAAAFTGTVRHTRRRGGGGVGRENDRSAPPPTKTQQYDVADASLPDSEDARSARPQPRSGPRCQQGREVRPRRHLMRDGFRA